MDIRLSEVEKDIENTLKKYKHLKFLIDRTSSNGSVNLSIEMHFNSSSNNCPMLLNSENDCAKCEFGYSWHLLKGRCELRLDIEDAFKPEFKAHPDDVKTQMRGIRKKRSKVGKKVSSEAIWI